ncbi:DUF3060 domain-containing protein [Curtobacterium sp. VKM Ac-2884]|uniref:DUF3060 domain-containing protein n=1 Tax=Curtobacterium sp. VKM Ac-2884 TaxID=2783818 RepID=UPI00188AA9A5|nr:DUF3060 domain-containing protein [Curtobacterium sp. VKM Ac-2884]MBF4605097.1 DUF3060 domain-containing protein [Curtobacterium sp. VKM Ac-2884]
MTPTAPLKALAVVCLGAAAALTLAGCSTADDDKASAKPSASATAETVDYGKCIDGQLTVLASQAAAGKTVEVADCASIAIVDAPKKGVTFTVGTTDKLVIEGSKLTVKVQSAKSIIVPGSGNSITHGGESAVEDLGSDNTVTKG